MFLRRTEAEGGGRRHDRSRKPGLAVSVNILNKEYATGRKVAADFKEQMGVIFDADLPQWNYRLPPREVHIGKVI